MNRILALVLGAAFALLASQADAATCFWVGGAATWDTVNTASWANVSGGVAGSCAATGNIPKNAGDVATFDANSAAAATITVGADFSIGGITITGAFTGNLNFGAHNFTSSTLVNYTGATSASGTLTCGTGTFTLTASTGGGWQANGTSLVESCASANFVFAPASSAASIGMSMKANGSYGPITITFPNYPGQFGFTITTAATIASLTVTGQPPAAITLSQSTTLTITAAPNITVGSLAKPIVWLVNFPTNNGAYTLTTPNTFACAYCLFNYATFTNATTMTNAWAGQNTTNLTATAPSGGGSKFLGGAVN